MITNVTAAGLMFSSVFSKYAPTGRPLTRSVGEQTAASNLTAAPGHSVFARQPKVFSIRFR